MDPKWNYKQSLRLSQTFPQQALDRLPKLKQEKVTLKFDCKNCFFIVQLWMVNTEITINTMLKEKDLLAYHYESI